VDLSYALSLGLVYWVGAEIKSIYDAVGIDPRQLPRQRKLFPARGGDLRDAAPTERSWTALWIAITGTA